MDHIILALQSMNPADLDYDSWLRIGMALKNEGYPVEVWENWSRGEARYHPGECEKKWASFDGYIGPKVGAGTIVQMAKEHGWHSDYGRELDWNDEISYEENDAGEGIPFSVRTSSSEWLTDEVFSHDKAGVVARKATSAYALTAPSELKNGETVSGLKGTEQLKLYLQTLFQPTDIVGYVTGDVWKNEDGRYLPAKGVYNRTAGELIGLLEKYPDDLGAVIGDWKEECGAWIRFNPLDGNGVKNENVTAYRYALVESDSMSLEEQEAVYRGLNLPIAALVYSGGKSLHAIVHIDAGNYEEYRERVQFLYGVLEQNGCIVDKQNRNPSRLSRMPGVTRNGKEQTLLAVNIGRKDWADWVNSLGTSDDGLPEMENMGYFLTHVPELPEQLIEGVLRCGHKMLIAGASKAGKSFLLLELCIALSEGLPWLGFPCRKSKVLYINLEIDPASCVRRVLKIYEAMGITPEHAEDLVVWNLRGKAIPLDKLVPVLLKRMQGQGFDAVILDPIYKVITGDENTASDMAYFTNQFDKICAETGASVIYCHHHSKGAQGSKKSQDRASGSGVFARDPDAVLDMIELTLTDDLKNNVRDGNATAWRMECSLREFANFKPVNFWFEYPLHRIDEDNLKTAFSDGSFEAVRAKNRKVTTPKQRRESVDTAYHACSIEPPVTLKAMAEYAGITERSMRDRLKEAADAYTVKDGYVKKNEET